MISVTRSVKNQDLATEMEMVSYVLENDTADGKLFMLFANDEARTPLYIPTVFQGETVKSMNLPAALLQGPHYCHKNIAGVHYLLHSQKVTIQITDYWLVSLMETNTFGNPYMINVLYTGLATLCFLLLLFPFITLTRKKNPLFHRDDPLEVYALNRKNEWNHKSADRKIGAVIGILMDLMAIWIIVIGIVSSANANVSPLMSWIMQFRWDRGFNTFSAISIGLLILMAHLIKHILACIMLLMKYTSSGRAETCIRLILSVSRYALTLFCFFYGLYLIGLNTVSVLTSLGGFSLLVGLGANKLFGDIVVGIFMILEGDIQIGDIVTIGDFCGKVTEIGIRTTKIENRDGNITILNNSSILKVLNMTRHNSRVKIDLSIKKQTSIEEVEACLTRILPEISEKCTIPHVNLGYMGVDKISGDSYVYRVECECTEDARNRLYRYLNRELCNELKKANIPVS